MKKVLSIIGVFAIITTFAGCSSSGSSSPKTSSSEMKETTIATTAEPTQTTQKPTEAPITADKTEPEAKPTEVPKTEAETETLVSAEKVIYDSNDIKITYTGLGKGAITQNVNFLIENNSNEDIVVQADNSSINDCMIYNMFSSTVNKGKKANDEMVFLLSALEKNKIDKIEKIEFTLKFFNPETFMTKYTSDPIVIYT